MLEQNNFKVLPNISHSVILWYYDSLQSTLAVLLSLTHTLWKGLLLAWPCLDHALMLTHGPSYVPSLLSKLHECQCLGLAWQQGRFVSDTSKLMSQGHLLPDLLMHVSPPGSEPSPCFCTLSTLSVLHTDHT